MDVMRLADASQSVEAPVCGIAEAGFGASHFQVEDRGARRVCC